MPFVAVRGKGNPNEEYGEYKGAFALNNGWQLDFSTTRLHHEIYLSDPRKTAPEKMKTVIRHPVRKV